MQRVAEPPFEQWGGVLEANVAARSARAERLGAHRFSAIRRAVVELAAEYSAEIAGVARAIGVETPAYPAGSLAEQDLPIVMAGHQPVVYHSGLLEKNLLLSRFVAAGAALGVQVVIDTDEGDAGQLVWPQRTADSLILRSGSIGTATGLFFAQRVVAAEQTADLFATLCADLRGAECAAAAERSQRIGVLYQRLAGESVAVAHSVVRWTYERRAYLEVPLSRLLKIPEVSALLEEWVLDYEHLSRTYNEVLEEYRREHKIKNAANPFPNMRVEAGAVEVPFWRIQGDSRRALTMPSGGESGSTPGVYIAPRGSIVTLALRGVCSDLFIHGRGGAKYDPFVDRFAERYLGVQLPSFVVASATQYLFPERVAQLDRALELKARYKEIISHTEKFLNGTLFTETEELFLQQCVAQRKVLLGELQAAASPEGRSAVAHRLNGLNREVKTFVDSSSVQARLLDANQPEVLQARWRYREYPFFLFDRSA